MDLKSHARCAALLFCVWIGVVAAVPTLRAQGEDVVILTMPDTIVSPEDSVYGLSFYLANPVSSVIAFEVIVAATRPDLMELMYHPSVDTFITCDGAVCDTSVDTINRVDMQVAGSPIQSWEYVQARAWTPSYLKVVCLHDLAFKAGTPPPIPPTDTAVFLFRVALQRIAEPWYLDTASERSVLWAVQPTGTSFLNPGVQNIPFPDSVVCLDPPGCTALDTVTIYPKGTITIAAGCTRWGDVNRDGVITSADIIALVSYVFKGGDEPGCSPDVGDVNCDDSVTSADIIFLVVHVFKGGPAPCVP